jgi:hypothetical protein
VFNLAVVIAHILYTKTSKKKNFPKIFYKKVTEGLLATARTEIQAHCQTHSPAGRIIGRENFLYRIPVTHAKLEGKSQHSCYVCAERNLAPDRENCEAVLNNVLPKM